MLCPECNKSMLILEFREIEVDYCPSCKGCWLDEGEMELILDTYREAITTWNIDGGQKGRRKCPRCRTHMHVVPLPDNGPEIDACPAGCGLWLDEGELAAVIRAHLPPGPAAELTSILSEIFGTEPPE